MVNKETLEDVRERLNKKYGASTILQGKGEYPPINAVPLSSIGFNIASAVGGVARGKLHRVEGTEGVGKSSICLDAAASFQREGDNVLWLDYEWCFDPEYASKYGVKIDDSLMLSHPYTLEDGYNLMIEYVKSGLIGLIVLDSVNAMCPAAMLNGDYEIGDSKVAIESRLHSSSLLLLKGLLAKHNVTMIAITQYRAQIGVMGAGNDKTVGGGNAYKYYPDVAWKIARLKSEKNSNGYTNTVEFMKNKVGKPFGKGVIAYVGGEGVDIGKDAVYYGELGNILTRKGNTYYDGEIKMGVGVNGVREFLLDNPEYYEELKKRILESVTEIR